MDINWLTNGAGSDGFEWHEPEERQTGAAMVDLQHQLKQIWYLEKAVEVSRSVARILFPGGKVFATCFLVAPNLIMTNHHVFGKAEDTEGVKIQFNYRKLANGDMETPEEYTCDAKTTFITNKPLDYTLVALNTNADKGRAVLPLQPDAALKPGSHIAIIQHPSGEPLQVAIRDNSLQFSDDKTIEYLTNTEYGSSGAPVFNDNWELIALHSQRVKDPTKKTTEWYRNRGTKVGAILENRAIAKLIP